jgi:hypothetical protein
MACYKCGQKLDCIIDDSMAPLTEVEKKEFVKLLKFDGHLCGEDERTVSGQQNCESVEFGFHSESGCCIPAPVIGDTNACPLRGQGLSNFGTYTVAVSLSGAMSCCPNSSYELVAHTPKCDSAGCTCEFCDELGTCGNMDGGQCSIEDALAGRVECGAPTEAPKVAEVPTPAPCDQEEYMTKKAVDVCPFANDPIVKVVGSSAGADGINPADFIYGITHNAGADGSAPTVTFKVDNPMTTTADIYVAYSKTAGLMGSDPDCASMPAQAGCSPDTTEITAVCHDYAGVDPFALVNVYIASQDPFMELVGEKATVQKCCHAPDYTDASWGVVHYALEIQCVCPPIGMARKNLRG